MVMMIIFLKRNFDNYVTLLFCRWWKSTACTRSIHFAHAVGRRSQLFSVNQVALCSRKGRYVRCATSWAERQLLFLSISSSRSIFEQVVTWWLHRIVFCQYIFPYILHNYLRLMFRVDVSKLSGPFGCHWEKYLDRLNLLIPANVDESW